MYGGKMMKIFILFLFIFISCKEQRNTTSSFYAQTKKKWIGATRLINIHKYVKEKETLKKPAGTWQKIFEVEYDENPNTQRRDCLFYYIPFDGESGIIKIVRFDEKCSFDGPNDDEEELKGIYNFSYEYRSDYKAKYQLILKIDDKVLKYSFNNFSKNELETKIGSSSNPTSKNYGVRVFPKKVNGEFLKKEIIEDGEVCFQVDSRCKIKKENHCDQCQGGSYSIIDNACPTKFTKVCGVNQCGYKNQAACIRGYISTDFKLDYCMNDSPVGFCQKGLRVICYNGKLICR